MKTISFSCVEKLPKLLDKSCCQTIRPLWKYVKVLDTGYEAVKPTEPRLKVGDKVTLYWKQRSKKKYSSLTQWFCTVCGNEIDVSKFPNEAQGYCKCGAYKNINAIESGLMTKILGTGTITEVFEIEMKANAYPECSLETFGFSYENKDSIFEIIKKDGFDKLENFTRWFFKHYDLSQPKRFVVYRWMWDDNV